MYKSLLLWVSIRYRFSKNNLCIRDNTLSILIDIAKISKKFRHDKKHMRVSISVQMNFQKLSKCFMCAKYRGSKTISFSLCSTFLNMGLLCCTSYLSFPNF